MGSYSDTLVDSRAWNGCNFNGRKPPLLLMTAKCIARARFRRYEGLVYSVPRGVLPDHDWLDRIRKRWSGMINNKTGSLSLAQCDDYFLGTFSSTRASVCTDCCRGHSRIVSGCVTARHTQLGRSTRTQVKQHWTNLKPAHQAR